MQYKSRQNGKKGLAPESLQSKPWKRFWCLSVLCTLYSSVTMSLINLGFSLQHPMLALSYHSWVDLSSLSQGHCMSCLAAGMVHGWQTLTARDVIADVTPAHIPVYNPPRHPP